MTETRKKGMNASVRMVLVLFLIAAITALCLGLVDFVTRDRIADYLAEKKAAAMQEVFAADSYEEIVYTGEDGRVVGISSAAVNGGVAGYVVEVIVGGSQGDINMLVGVDTIGNISGVAIVDMNGFNTIPVRDPIKVLISCGTSGNVCDTIVNGKVLMKDRVLLSMNREEVSREAWKAARTIWSRVPNLNELAPLSCPVFDEEA